MIERTEDGWFFWNDDFTYCYGPFSSYDEAHNYLKKYKRWAAEESTTSMVEQMNN